MSCVCAAGLSRPSVTRSVSKFGWNGHSTLLAFDSDRRLGVTRESNRRLLAYATSSIARLKASSLAGDGWWYPLIFLTNCSAAAFTSSAVGGCPCFRRTLMLLHKVSSWAGKLNRIAASHSSRRDLGRQVKDVPDWRQQGRFRG